MNELKYINKCYIVTGRTTTEKSHSIVVKLWIIIVKLLGVIAKAFLSLTRSENRSAISSVCLHGKFHTSPRWLMTEIWFNCIRNRNDSFALPLATIFHIIHVLLHLLCSYKCSVQLLSINIQHDDEGVCVRVHCAIVVIFNVCAFVISAATTRCYRMDEWVTVNWLFIVFAACKHNDDKNKIIISV